MAKLKTFIKGFRPKAGDEKKFFDKHIALVHDDRNGNGDDVFQAKNVKFVDREEEDHGYNPGQDEEVYEETEIVMEASPITGTRKVSTHQGQNGHHAEVRYNPEWEEYSVHHYRDGKHLGEGPVSYHGDDKKDAQDTAKHSIKNFKFNEEVESIDEVSPQTLGSYIHKSKKDEDERRQAGVEWRDEVRKKTGIKVGTPIDRKLYHPTASRKAYRDLAIKKLTGAAKVNANESLIDRIVERFTPEDYQAPSEIDLVAEKVKDLPEGYRSILLRMYESLNEDNRPRMSAGLDDPETTRDLIEFAIEHRNDF